MKCKYCGENNKDTDYYCVGCGRKLPVTSTLREYPVISGIVSFIFPIIGLILFLLFRDTRPRTSKTSIKLAIIGFITYFVLIIAFIIWIINGIEWHWQF